MSSNQEDVLHLDNLSSMSSNLTICPPIGKYVDELILKLPTVWSNPVNFLTVLAYLLKAPESVLCIQLSNWHILFQNNSSEV